MSTQTDFNTAYRVSQPPALANFPFSASSAAALAAQGYLVDVPIMVNGWEPWTTMNIRESLGMTWVPSALQQPLGSPTGYALPNVPILPGQTPYPTTPPAGAIKISTNVSDYPPYVTPPIVKETDPTIDPVGGLNFGNIYFPVQGFNYTNNETFTDTRGTFTAVVVSTPFGNETYLELGTGTN